VLTRLQCLQLRLLLGSKRQLFQLFRSVWMHENARDDKFPVGLERPLDTVKRLVDRIKTYGLR
jgi:hypothetical protein